MAANDSDNGGSARPTSREPTREARETWRETEDAAARPTQKETESSDGAPAQDVLAALLSRLGVGWEIERPLPTHGGEADLYVLTTPENDRRVAKLYRADIAPKVSVLDQIAAPASAKHLVRMYQHGTLDVRIGRVDQTRHFELLEYITHGSLVDLVASEGRANDARLRAIVKQLSEALRYVHSLKIAHRDVKPSNVLVRSREPLDLVLTDFGIASLMGDASRRYTGRDRTIMYAAPEAGSMISYASDWWSLGMIVLELVKGEHPFAKLDEAAIAATVAQIAMDDLVVGVKEPWRSLCRGLLRRNAKSRWGEAQVQRWLAGDTSIEIVEEGPQAGSVREPFALVGQQYTDLRDIAEALRRNWAAARDVVASGKLEAWINDQAPSNDWRNFFRDINRGQDDLDTRVAAVIARLDVGQAPFFKGWSFTPAELRRLAVSAHETSRDRDTLCEILRLDLLGRYPESSGYQWRHAVNANWKQQVSAYDQLAANSTLPERARALAGERRGQACAALLLAVLPESGGDVDRMRHEARRAHRRAGSDCDWYRSLGSPERAGPATLYLQILWADPAQRVSQAAEQERARDRSAKFWRRARGTSLAILVIGAVGAAAWYAWTWQREQMAITRRVAGMITGVTFFEGEDQSAPEAIDSGADVGVRVTYANGVAGRDSAAVEFARAGEVVQRCTNLAIESSEGSLNCRVRQLPPGAYEARVAVNGRRAATFPFSVGDGRRIFRMPSRIMVASEVTREPTENISSFLGPSRVGFYAEYQDARDGDDLSVRLYENGIQIRSCPNRRATAGEGVVRCFVGMLPPGSYEFKLVINGEIVRTASFTVNELAPESPSDGGPITLTPPGATQQAPPIGYGRYPAPFTITSPVWERSPAATRIARFYPSRALDRGEGGRVVLDCTAQYDGSLTCGVFSEEPQGMGFGEAAVRASREFRLRPRMADGRPVTGGTLRLPIVFQVE